MIKQETPEPVTGSNIKPARKEITCFSCHQKGHKLPQCPQKQTHIKRIQIPSNKAIPLRDNELFGSVGVHRLPITCDSGADISVIPEECVSPEQLTGETCEIDSFIRKRTSGKVCDIVISVNGKEFKRRAVTQPGVHLAWTACLSLPFANKDDWSFITNQMQNKFLLSEEDNLYLPPEMRDGILVSGLLVSEGTLVESEDNQTITQKLNLCMRAKCNQWSGRTMVK